jgi:serine/threonine protein kinase
VLHRDIKPQNILLDGSDEPYLTDFGLVRVLGTAGMTRDGVFLGTPNYASPEQARLERLDGRSDIYALGVVLFEMAAGRRPFVSTSTEDVLEHHRTKAPPDLSELRPDLPGPLVAVVSRCLQKDPADRFADTAELARALRRVPV